MGDFQLNFLALGGYEGDIRFRTSIQASQQMLLHLLLLPWYEAIFALFALFALPPFPLPKKRSLWTKSMGSKLLFAWSGSTSSGCAPRTPQSKNYSRIVYCGRNGLVVKAPACRSGRSWFKSHWCQKNL